MKRFVSGAAIVFLIIGCGTPPANAPESEPEQAPQSNSGGIPWADGEAPSAAETTREVSAEPRRHEISAEATKEDGLQQTAPSQVCTGKAPPMLRSSVQLRADETRSCYDKVPESKKGARGEVRVQLRVGTSGQVEKLSIVKDTFAVPEATSCIREILSKPFESQPRGGCALFLVPIQLASEEEESQPASSGAKSSQETTSSEK